jgi:hypothetical protein
MPPSTPPPPDWTVPGVLHPTWAQQSHHHIEELIELMNAEMGRAITHTSTLPWVAELLQNKFFTSPLLTSQGG